jgi:hypothetical protein
LIPFVAIAAAAAAAAAASEGGVETGGGLVVEKSRSRSNAAEEVERSVGGGGAGDVLEDADVSLEELERRLLLGETHAPAAGTETGKGEKKGSSGGGGVGIADLLVVLNDCPDAALHAHRERVALLFAEERVLQHRLGLVEVANPFEDA